MKKYILYLLIVMSFLPQQIVYAAEPFYYGNTQEQLYSWYIDETDISTFKLTTDLVIDQSDYSTFVETPIKKQIDTGYYSLIINTSASFENPNLTIFGSGLDQNNNSHPVLQLDSEDYSEIKYLKVDAKDGDSVYIGKNQLLDTTFSLSQDFPIILTAQNYAVIYEAEQCIEFNTTKMITESQNAVYVIPNPNRDPSNVCDFTYSEVNRLENPQQYFYTYAYINEEWWDGTGIVTDSINEEILEYDDQIYDLYVADMLDIENTAPNKVGVEGSPIEITWNLSQVNLAAKTNTIYGKLLINPRFSPLIKTDIILDVYKVEASPINDLNISWCDFFINNTYRVWFNMTYPYLYKDATFQVSMDNIHFKSYNEDILIYLECNYNTSYTAEVTYGINDLSALLPDKTYYFRVYITGGLREGYSNTIKFNNGEWESLDTLVPTLPDIDENKPNEDKPDSSKPDTNEPTSPPKEPEIEVGKPNGDDGHRGDENRGDVPEEDNQIIIKEEQLQGLEKAGEDIMMMIDNTQFIISHEQIQEWSQQNEEVTLTLEDEQINYKSDSQEKQLLDIDVTVQKQVKQADSLFSWQLILGGTVIFIAIGNLYSRRKRRGK